MAASPFKPLTVEARDLSCSRGGRLIFSGLSFSVGPGRLFLVTGPNGSGKSTLLRLVAGLLKPEAGALEIMGRGVDAPVAHYLGHAEALKPSLTVAETLRFWAVVYGSRPTKAELSEATAAVGLGHALNVATGILSAGQRRRVALARLLLSPRPLWLLDEPFTALDAEGAALVGGLMDRHLGRDGVIVAATHQEMPVRAHASLRLGVRA
jgi:heme exporter protein A